MPLVLWLKKILIALTLHILMAKIPEFANSLDPDEVAHNEPPHLDLYYLPSSH